MLGSKVHKIEFKDRPADNHNVFVGRDLLCSVSKFVAKDISNKRQAIITDRNVANAGHLAKLYSDGEIPTFIVEPDDKGSVETSKNILTYGRIINFLDSHGFEKSDVLLCLGGGVIGDIGGYVAATYKRGGMKYIQIPTTTSSQADSCVGGKCGVNSEISKNAVGRIYQPHLAVSDVDTLFTLDERNFRSGLVEPVKHGLILSGEYFSFLERNMDGILGRDVELLEEIVLMSVKLKGGVVGQDPDETNHRKGLNFGHTISHAIEFVSGFRLSHGEGLALGIRAGLQISRSPLGHLSAEACARAEALLSRLDMPARVPSYIDRGLVEKKLAGSDKKAVDGVPYFVRIEDIGILHIEKGEYASTIPKGALDAALDYIFR